ncbi:hypothetical protein VKT23_014386 [Stygiomarasmius scandens]|uniref:Uncharacterized protein n=1 Tax=Marasmiellus scandens TaxID=2682957 RepID=A0ABR1J0F6_9AGAR
MIKFKNSDEQSSIGQVLYFFRLRFGDAVYTLAMVSVFSAPNSKLLEDSYGTVYACHYQGEAALLTIDVKKIQSVVAMVPYFNITGTGDIETHETLHFLVEKPGLEITELKEAEKDDEERDDDDQDLGENDGDVHVF